MENIYSKFLSPGNGTTSFNSYYTPQRSFNKIAHSLIKDNMRHVQKNNIDNFFQREDRRGLTPTPQKVITPFTNNLNGSKTPQGQLIKTIDGVYKYIPLEVNFTGPNPIRSANFNESQFASFDNHSFMNSQVKPVPENNFSPTVMQVQMLSEKVRIIERSHAEEKSQLLSAIKSQILSNNQPEESIVNTKRKNIQKKIDKHRNSQNSSDDEIEENEVKSLQNNFTRRNNNASQNNLIKANSNSNNILDKIIIVPTSKPPVILNDSEIVARTLQEIRDEIFLKLQEESLRNQESLSKMTTNFKQLKNEIFNKIEYMDHKQRLNTENFRYCLERSGIPRMKLLTKKIFDGEDIDIDDEELNEAGLGRSKTKETDKKFGRGGAKDPNLLNEQDDEDNKLLDYMENKKQNNARLEKDLEGNENNILEEIDKIKKENAKGLKEKLQNKHKIQNERLKLQADKYKNKPYE